MEDIDSQLLDLALEARLLTRKQADFVRQQRAEEPNTPLGEILLARHYVTEEQLADLQARLGGGSPAAGGPQAATPAPPHQQAPAPQAFPQPETVPLRPPNRPQARPQGPQPQQLRPPQQQPAPHPQQPAPAPAVQRPPATSPSGTPKNLAAYLKIARHWGCSDLHLSVGRPPFIRLHGRIRYMEEEPLTPERAEQLNFSALDPEQRKTAAEKQQLDFALEVAGVGRYRCSIFNQRLGWDGAYRVIPAQIPTLDALGFPESVHVLTEYNQGLVMVTGPGGSGKTTTVAAMVDLVNVKRHDHIITVEDPVEYVVPPKNCQVTQREVGRHTEAFSAALRAALREDPDIIFIGELRDLETTSIAISAAETGHLVFSTLHTSSAVRTVSRIVDVYPVNQQRQVCVMVAESLRGVICQQLLPRVDGTGVALALEILMNTSGVATQIKEGKTHMVQSLIQGGKKYGMCTMEESLLNLMQNNVISPRSAYNAANNKTPFEAALKQAEGAPAPM